MQNFNSTSFEYLAHLHGNSNKSDTDAILLNCPDRAHLAYGMREEARERGTTCSSHGGRPQGASTREARRGGRAAAAAAPRPLTQRTLGPVLPTSQ